MHHMSIKLNLTFLTYQLPLLERLCLTAAVTQSGSARNTKTPRRDIFHLISFPLHLQARFTLSDLKNGNTAWSDLTRLSSNTRGLKPIVGYSTSGWVNVRVFVSRAAAVKPFSSHSVLLLHIDHHVESCVRCVYMLHMNAFVVLYFNTHMQFVWSHVCRCDLYMFECYWRRACLSCSVRCFWTVEYSWTSCMCVLMMQDWCSSIKCFIELNSICHWFILKLVAIETRVVFY